MTILGRAGVVEGRTTYDGGLTENACPIIVGIRHDGRVKLALDRIPPASASLTPDAARALAHLLLGAAKQAEGEPTP